MPEVERRATTSVHWEAVNQAGDAVSEPASRAALEIALPAMRAEQQDAPNRLRAIAGIEAQLDGGPIIGIRRVTTCTETTRIISPTVTLAQLENEPGRRGIWERIRGLFDGI